MSAEAAEAGRIQVRGSKTDVDGIIEKKIFSNLTVKSKSPRQPTTPGPTAPSFRQPENSMLQ